MTGEAAMPITGRLATESLAAIDWPAIGAQLDAQGYALFGQILDRAACDALVGLYARDAAFRSRVIMARHGFGQGEYRYFAAPLPDLVGVLRAGFYAGLAPVANRWRAALGEAGHFPPQLDDFLAECHRAGQTRPTPLLLRYGPGDHNRLHQDLYGPLVFPLQVVVLLREPDVDFTGGGLVLVEQKPRAQSRAEIVPLRLGEAVAFAVSHRPVRGTRGTYRTVLRHGVSTVRSGLRFTLGLIFHDAA